MLITITSKQTNKNLSPSDRLGKDGSVMNVSSLTIATYRASRETGQTGPIWGALAQAPRTPFAEFA
jgi:hypothetical protein